MKEGSTAFKIVTGKPTGKRTLGRPKLRSGDKIRIGFKELQKIKLKINN